MYRTSKIAEELASKTDLMDARGCNTNMRPDLIAWSGLTINADPSDLISLRATSNNIERKNNRELCNVWE